MAVLALSACATGESWVDDGFLAATPEERQVVDRAAAGDRLAAHVLFAESQDPALDGERSEQYTARLMTFLRRAGPRKFLIRLRAESNPSRSTVARFLEPAIPTGPESARLREELRQMERPAR